MLYPLTVLVAVTIATWAFVYGDQPVILDAAGYVELAKAIVAGGPGAFASDTRTYGYPAFLAVIIRVVGQDVVDVQTAVFVVQLASLLAAAWIGARRIGGALGLDGVGPAIFVATAANPFLLINAVQVLTELPATVLLYVAVALSLPQQHAERPTQVTLLAVCALLCAGLAVMVRPASLIMVPVVVGIWVVRARVFRDVPWKALPVGLLALALPFVPQVLSNQRAFGVASPLIVRSLYTDMMVVGFEYAKTAALVIPGAPTALSYHNPFRPPPELTIRQVILERPDLFLGTLAVHTFALLDQDYAFTYIRDVDPWHRWPLSTLSNLFFLGAIVGLVVGLRRTANAPPATINRRRFALLALGAAALSVVAVYVPTQVENRYALPLYPLLAAPFVIAVSRISVAVPTAGASRLALGATVIAIWLGGAAMLSVWLQAQAPMLVALREGSIGPRAIAQRVRPVAGPTPSPGPTAPPAREVPLATYLADLPKDLTAKRLAAFDVTVTNAGHEIWNVQGAYPVNVAARFVAQTTELHERVKGVMRDSQSVALPNDVAPGESATVRLQITAPPVPGRYTLRVHVTRAGLPDSDTVIERLVRVVTGR